MNEDCKQYCLSQYKEIFEGNLIGLPIKNAEEKRKAAQKIAIRETSISAITKFPDVEPSDIWKTIYVAHVHTFSGIEDVRIISSVISADNSWKKSSGHAFEEMIKELANLYLSDHNIKMVLQKELSVLIAEKKILNEVRDLSWLREQIKSSVFDLYLIVREGNGFFVYGCIQSKTSIRDRVTRDREPSINAMAAFFMSVAIVLDGDFLRLPKFKNMVNGNVSGYTLNGWHGMYVFTNAELENDRIYGIDITMDKFINHAIQGAEFWQKQRQWFNHTWKPL